MTDKVMNEFKSAVGKPQISEEDSYDGKPTKDSALGMVTYYPFHDREDAEEKIRELGMDPKAPDAEMDVTGSVSWTDERGEDLVTLKRSRIRSGVDEFYWRVYDWSTRPRQELSGPSGPVPEEIVTALQAADVEYEMLAGTPKKHKSGDGYTAILDAGEFEQPIWIKVRGEMIFIVDLHNSDDEFGTGKDPDLATAVKKAYAAAAEEITSEDFAAKYN